MLSGVCLAVKRINDMSDILPDYKIKLVPSCTEVCSETVCPESLISLARYAFDSDCSIVGLLCPSVTDVISRLAGRPEVKLLQVSAGDSPQTRNYRQNYRVVIDQGCAVVMPQ